MSRKKLKINGTDISTYGIYISSDTYLNSPMIDYSEYQIPARDGNAIIDNKRLNNVMRKFDCHIPESGNIDTALQSLKKLIYGTRGYVQIESDYDPSVYMWGYFAQELNVEPFVTRSATFSLYFSCLPQKIFSTDTEYQTTNNIGNSTFGEGFRPNNDPDLVKILSKAKNDYPYSPIGWLFTTDDSDALSQNTTYTFNAVSTDTKYYILVMDEENIDNSHTYTYIGEVTNYKAKIRYTTPTPLNSATLIYAVPILKNNVNISTTWSSNSANIQRDYTTFTSTSFTNTNAFGCSPVFVIEKTVNTSNLSTGTGCIDLYAINDNFYYLDLISFANDYTNRWINNNLVINKGGGSYCMYFMLDFVNMRAYVLKTKSFTADVLLDISNYLVCWQDGDLGDTISVKFGTATDDDGVEFIVNGIVGKASFKMGWWKL